MSDDPLNPLTAEEKIRSEARSAALEVARLNFKRAEALQTEVTELKRQLAECECGKGSGR